MSVALPSIFLDFQAADDQEGGGQIEAFLEDETQLKKVQGVGQGLKKLQEGYRLQGMRLCSGRRKDSGKCR